MEPKRHFGMFTNKFNVNGIANRIPVFYLFSRFSLLSMILGTEMHSAGPTPSILAGNDGSRRHSGKPWPISAALRIISLSTLHSARLLTRLILVSRMRLNSDRSTHLLLRRRWTSTLVALFFLGAVLQLSAQPSFGPIFDQFRLTLAPGHRTEVLGPLFYAERKESTRVWGAPPVLSYTLDQELDFEEFDFVYPLLSYDRFGSEYRFHIFQIFSFAGGKTQSETNVSRFTLFPLYFQQRSPIPEKNYTALIPIYGNLKNRLFRDEVHFVMLPIYVQSRKRDVVTDNYLYPFFHLRHGEGLTGWQFWPLYGQEHKEITTQTNAWGDSQIVAGHDDCFVLWPFFNSESSGIGTTNPVHHQVLVPLYSRLRSPNRDSTSYLWPIGVTHTVDRENKYTGWATPWPIIVFERGEGKTTSRILPLFSQSHNATQESDSYLWPVVKYSRINSPPLDRRRTQILFFLYSDISERNTEARASMHRTDFWPFFTARRGFNGDRRLQILAILEPFLPGNKSIERDYAPIYSFWRSEMSAETGASSQSLLWNLYRHDARSDSKKYSLLFGLFQYQSSIAGRQWRVLYIPLGKSKPAPAGPEAR